MLRQTTLNQLSFDLADHLVLCLSWFGKGWPFAATDAGRFMYDPHEIAAHGSANLNFDVFGFQHELLRARVSRGAPLSMLAGQLHHKV